MAFFRKILLILSLSVACCSILGAKAIECSGVYTVALSASVPMAGSQGEAYPILNLSSGDMLVCSLVLERLTSGMDVLMLVSADGVRREEVGYGGERIDWEVFLDCDKGEMKITGLSREVIFPDLDFPLYRMNVSCPLEGVGGVKVHSFEIMGLKNGKVPGLELILILLILVLDIGVILFAYVRHSRKKSSSQEAPSVSNRKSTSVRPSTGTGKGSISLFGEFSVLTPSGEEISPSLSRTAKELLAILICHSPGKGISSKELKDLLWFYKDEKSATNNRSVYFSKLRALMKDVGSFSITSVGGYWKVDAPDIDIDYLEYAKILKKKEIGRDDITRLTQIVSRGTLLSEFENIWADRYKADVSDSIISLFGGYMEKLDIGSDGETILGICDIISGFDSLSEQVLAMRCRIAKTRGQHARARQVYDNFSREYSLLYGESYQHSFDEIVSDGYDLTRKY